jgi:phage terminase large subunit-like protein
MLLTSTAGHADSVVLRAFYDRLRRQASGDEAPDPTFYGAWWESEDENAGLDWAQIKRANPALGDGRLTRQAIASEFAILPADSWRRERLNHFVDVRADGAFNPGVWAACRVEDPLGGLSGPFALGVDVQPGWERATICVAGIRTDGRIGVEVFQDIRGTPEAPVTAARITDWIGRFPDPVSVIAYDGVSGAAAALQRDADDTGFPYDSLKPAAIVAACMDVDEMIRAGRLAVDDPLLDAQIPLAARRPVGADGAFRFSRAASLGPIDAVMAMVLAAHAIAYTGPEPKIT